MTEKKNVKKPDNAQGTSAMWGGRFSAGPSAVMEAINASIGFDQKLYAQDIQGSKAHAQMLADQGILSGDDAAAIIKGLEDIKSEIESGDFEFKAALEDIHMNVESRLRELVGDAAGRLHTARSRNDQVATDFRLWVRDQLDAADGALVRLMRALVAQAEAGADWVMPGFTHLQTAQPVTLGHHLMAYYEMAARDVSRFRDARARLNQCPLGSAALAGTGFPIDREATAHALGFDRPTRKRLANWRSRAQQAAAEKAGYAFHSYAQAKLSGIVDRLADLGVGDPRDHAVAGPVFGELGRFVEPSWLEKEVPRTMLFDIRRHAA